jgi:hypothetical protein
MINNCGVGDFEWIILKDFFNPEEINCQKEIFNFNRLKLPNKKFKLNLNIETECRNSGTFIDFRKSFYFVV